MVFTSKLQQINVHLQAKRGSVFAVILCLLISGCETGHLWSLYSLGFTKRDAYLDNLSDARDTLEGIVERIKPVVTTEAALDKPQRKVINSADEKLKLFSKQIKTTDRIGSGWIKQWTNKPQQFVEQEFTLQEAETSQRMLLTQARKIAKQFHLQLKKPKAVDLDALLVHMQAATIWVDAVNKHIAWIESSESGYPIKAD